MPVAATAGGAAAVFGSIGGASPDIGLLFMQILVLIVILAGALVLSMFIKKAQTTKLIVGTVVIFLIAFSIFFVLPYIQSTTPTPCPHLVNTIQLANGSIVAPTFCFTQPSITTLSAADNFCKTKFPNSSATIDYSYNPNNVYGIQVFEPYYCYGGN